MRRLIERYRLPESFLKYSRNGDPTQREGFFTFGGRTVCFGPCSVDKLAPSLNGALRDVRGFVRFNGDILHLPFDPDQLVDNLLLELYPAHGRNLPNQGLLRSVYYALRPLLPATLRMLFQCLYLADWEKIRFPRWPVDNTVDQFLEQCLALLMKAQGLDAVPFI